MRSLLICSELSNYAPSQLRQKESFGFFHPAIGTYSIVNKSETSEPCFHS